MELGWSKKWLFTYEMNWYGDLSIKMIWLLLRLSWKSVDAQHWSCGFFQPYLGIWSIWDFGGVFENLAEYLGLRINKKNGLDTHEVYYIVYIKSHWRGRIYNWYFGELLEIILEIFKGTPFLGIFFSKKICQPCKGLISMENKSGRHYLKVWENYVP